ncbi:hypothetical protein [Rugamonas apoptosis]|uniref:Uncharacterized protein n=1 Tax=Rugamonas apoptosis TaxID=2758570 RepID=A0A7W2IK30_9BURK|nr:hypothetical protein [Rugamonas apoptosis]MBA5686972.1 hypothetical protein [Rugamonas apoptosis]
MSRQTAALVLNILAAVESMEAPQHARYALARFITEQCQAAGIKAVDRAARVQFARRLLDAGEPRSTIRDRLMVRFDICRSVAYSAIEAALQLSGKREKKRTQVLHDGLT